MLRRVRRVDTGGAARGHDLLHARLWAPGGGAEKEGAAGCEGRAPDLCGVRGQYTADDEVNRALLFIALSEERLAKKRAPGQGLIKGRALRRYGELRNQIEPAKGGQPFHSTEGGAAPSSRTAADRAAGMSPDQAKRAKKTSRRKPFKLFPQRSPEWKHRQTPCGVICLKPCFLGGFWLRR